MAKFFLLLGKNQRLYAQKRFFFPVLEFWNKGVFSCFLQLFFDILRSFPEFLGDFPDFVWRK